MQTKSTQSQLGLSYGVMVLVFSFLATAMCFLTDDTSLKIVWLLISAGSTAHGFSIVKANLAGQ